LSIVAESVVVGSAGRVILTGSELVWLILGENLGLDAFDNCSVVTRWAFLNASRVFEDCDIIARVSG
jgi:hypothetical protein